MVGFLFWPPLNVNLFSSELNKPLCELNNCALRTTFPETPLSFLIVRVEDATLDPLRFPLIVTLSTSPLGVTVHEYPSSSSTLLIFSCIVTV